MILRMLLPFILLLVLPDLYIYKVYIRHRAKTKAQKWLYWAPTILLSLLLLLLFLGHLQHVSAFKYFFVVFLCFVAPKMLFTIFSLIGKGLSYLHPVCQKIFDTIGCVLGLCAVGILIYGSVWGWKHFTVKEQTFVSADLPAAFDGYKIVQFSDMHIGTLIGNEEEVGNVMDLINSQNANMICFTGDLVNGNANELNTFVPYLSKLKAPDGVYSIMGNHDYCTYGAFANEEARKQSVETLHQTERNAGWDLLLNENRIIRKGNDSIALVGVENDGRPPFPQYGDLPKATAGLSKGCFKLLLSHDPTHWRRRVLPETDIQLMLAGHTHGMQVQFGSFSPASFAYDEWGGLYEENGRGLYISLGIGEVMFPFRFGAWPEINVITLKKK